MTITILKFETMKHRLEAVFNAYYGYYEIIVLDKVSRRSEKVDSASSKKQIKIKAENLMKALCK